MRTAMRGQGERAPRLINSLVLRSGAAGGASRSALPSVRSEPLTGSWFETRGLASLLTMRALIRRCITGEPWIAELHKKRLKSLKSPRRAQN
jgi:hypothetical protein